jgi:hypothetical protein
MAWNKVIRESTWEKNKPLQFYSKWLVSRINFKYLNSKFCSLYIHGGRDIKEGSMNNMWRLSINGIKELIEDPEYGVSWE